MQRSTKVLALVAASSFLTAFDVTVISVAFQTLKQHFGGSPLTTWTVSGYNIAFAAGLLTAGKMADSFGRKRAFLIGVGVFSVASMGCGLAQSVGAMIAARAVQALGAALIVPSGMALLMPEFPVERRAVAVGSTATAGGLGAAFGPVLGGVVVDHLGWQWIFFINVPVCVVMIVAGARLLRETRAADTIGRLPDFAGAAAVLGAVGLITYVLLQSESHGWANPVVPAAVVGAALLGVVFVRRSRSHPSPVLDLSLLQLRYVSAANVAGFAYAAGFYAHAFITIQWLREVWEFSPSRAGLAFLPGPIVSSIVSPVGGRLAQRYGHMRTSVPGIVLLCSAATGFSFSDPAGPYVLNVLPFALMTGAGIGLSIGVLSSAASAYLPPSRFAMGSALYATGRQVGGALGVASCAAVLAASSTEEIGLRWSFRAVAACMVVAAIAMVALFRPPTAAELERSAAG